MFKSKKIKHIEKVIYSCKTRSQWLNTNLWLVKLYKNGIISLIQWNNLSVKSFEHVTNLIQNLEEYQWRLNSV